MKRFLSALLALALSLSLTAPALGAGAAVFSDVPAGYWAHSYIEKAAQAGVVNGTGDGLFSPEQTLTAAEFTAMILRAVCGMETDAAPSPSGKWYGPYTAAADDLGLYENTSVAGRFAASGMEGEAGYASFLENELDWAVSRYDMAAMMFNLAAAGDAGTGLPYTEEDLESALDWAESSAGTAVADWGEIPQSSRESVAFCFQNGLLTGMDEKGTFLGAESVTRAQAAVVLCRLLDAKEEAPAVQEPAEPSAPSAPETEPVAPETKPAEEPETAPAAPETDPAEEPAGPEVPLMPNGQPMTEENVRAAIEALKTEFPEGMTWTNDNMYQSTALRINGYGCAGFALKCSDTAFGSLPVSRKHSTFDDIRVGDMLRVNNNTHSVIVLEKRENSVIVAEGNYNNSIHWGREITRDSLAGDSQFYVETRYPQGA